MYYKQRFNKAEVLRWSQFSRHGDASFLTLKREVLVGVVGTLQFDVFQYRMKAEYGVDLRMQQLPYEQLRFITKAPVTDLKDLYLSTDAELLEDYRGRSLLVFASQWSINFILKRNPGLELSETAQ